MRRLLVMLFGALILIVTHHAIYSRERLITAGEVLLLRLAPVDPRSLMQGDYMRLRFEVADQLRKVLGDLAVADGHVVIAMGDDGVGAFSRIDDGAALAANERRMRFRLRDRGVKFGTNAFFFEEGTAAVYSQAVYGEFRVDTDGEAILTHLRGEGLQRLQPGPAG
jgi:uncharacterized membrane-anchored protein